MDQIVSIADSHLVTEFSKTLDRRVAAGDISAATKRTYMLGLDRYRSDGIADVWEWKTALRSDVSAATINTWLSGVKAFYAWAVSSGHTGTDPATGVKGVSIKGKSHKRGTLTDTEVKRALQVYMGDDLESRRNRAIMFILAYTGARLVELIRASKADLYTEQQRLVLRVQGKGRSTGDTEPLVIPASAADSIYDYICLHEGYAPLFYSLSKRNYGEGLSLRSYQRIVMDAYSAAGVIDTGKPKTAHSLRHTAISSAINNGAPLHKVQGMARHANISTTMIYFHEIDRVKTPAEDFISYESTV